jgi:phage terminase large subunit-like protein
MADAAITRAHKQAARLAAKRVPRRSSADATPSEHVRKARESFSYFCTAMGKPPVAHMQEWHRQLITGDTNDHLMDVSGPNTCLLSPRGPLDLSTPVLTPTGWRSLRNIEPGDEVYASSGRVTVVEEVLDYGTAPCWEVLFSDGTSMICDDSHRFEVRKAAGGPWQECTLEMLRTGALLRQGAAPGDCTPWLTRGGLPRWAVPITSPVDLPEAPLVLDPYLMGVLLARGGLSGAAVRFTSGDDDLVTRVASALPHGCQLGRISAKTICWSISGIPVHLQDRRSKRAPRNPILPLLEIFGLWGCRVPDRPMPVVFLRGSISQRLALLQGMLDAAGSSRPGGTISLPQRSGAVADGLAELVRSLGGLAQVKPIRRPSGGEGFVVEALLPPELEPFHSGAKTALYHKHRESARRPLRRTITDIRPAGEREIGCITVESPLQNFLIRDYVVSCNSAKSTVIGLLCSWLIGRHTLAKQLLRILYVSFNIDVARGKSLAIKNTIQSAEYQEIFPCVRLSKTRTADELWSIDFDFADIDVRGEDAFTLACAGLQGTITSKRSSLVILDDLIKSKKSISNPEVRREMEGNWNSVIVPTMFQGARAIALGTRFHFDDMFATTFVEKNGWHVMTQAALDFDDDGTPRSYWEGMWSVRYLLELQRKDPIAFAYQYLNKAVRSTELGMSPDLFVKGLVPDVFDEIGVGIDFSSALRERSDYTVFMLGGRVDDKAYVIDMRRIRSMGNIEKIEALCDMLHEWNLVTKDETSRYLSTFSEVAIWPESVGYQKSFEWDFKRVAYQEWGLTNLRVQPVTGVRGDKLARFRGVMGLFQTHRVIFNKYRDFQVVFDEVVNMGHSSHDDCADALQILLDRLFRRGNIEVEY